MSTPPDDAQATRDQGMAARAARGRGDPARRPRRDADRRARRSRCWASPDHATYRDHWPLLESTANAWVRLRPGDAGSRQRATGAAAEACDRRPHRGAGAGRQLAARGRRHLCRLRQSKGPDRGQFRRADAALSGNPADADGPARRAAEDPGADLGAAGKIRARRPQRRRSGDDEGGIDADLQPHLRGDRGAERLHARRRRHRAADQPADAEPIPACRNWRRYGRSASRGGSSRRSNF